jgi:hypothetical protein
LSFLHDDRVGVVQRWNANANTNTNSDIDSNTLPDAKATSNTETPPNSATPPKSFKALEDKEARFVGRAMTVT